MSHAYSRNFVHVVFSTKERHKWIRDCRAVWSLIADAIRSYGAEPIEVGGTTDHVHVLIQVPPKISVVTLVRAMKANSSKSINEAGHLFAWQQGYGCFSVSASSLEKVRVYIQRQGEHHRKHSFEEEFKALLAKHGIKFSEERVLG
jgi:REP element-mobilizing transposase RayT